MKKLISQSEIASSQTDGFIDIGKSRSGSKRTSSLFYYLAKYDWQKLFTPRLSFNSPSNDHRYFIINLNPSDSEIIPLFDTKGYRLIERHIRIDEKFGVEGSKLANVQLFTHWHYTESYQKIDAPNYINHVRNYFNYNRLLAVYVTEHDQCKVIKTDAKFLAVCENNSAAARKILQKLMQALSGQREVATNNLNMSFAQITNLTSSYNNSESAILQTLEQCRISSETLNLLNDNDDIDCRYKLLNDNINEIMKRKESSAPKATLASTVFIEQDTIVSTKAADICRNSKKPLKTVTRVKNIDNGAKPIEVLEKELQALERLYQNVSPKNVVELENKKNKFQIELSFIFVTAKVKDKRISALANKLTTLPSALSLFIKCASYGDLQGVQELYNHTRNQIPNSFYCNFFRDALYNNLNEETEKKHCDIMTYLYKKSDAYRLFISISPTVLLTHPDRLNMGTSFAFRFFNAQKQQLFKLYIDQIGRSNIIALSFKGYAVSLTNFIAANDTSAENVLLGFILDKTNVLENNVFSSHERTMLIDIAVAATQINKDFNFFVNHSEDKNAAATVYEQHYNITRYLESQARFAPIDSIFYAYCNNPMPNGAMMITLARRNSDFHFALGFAKIIDRVEGRSTLPSAKDKTDIIAIYSNDNERQTAARKHLEQYGNKVIRFKTFCLLNDDRSNIASMFHYATQRYEAMTEDGLISLSDQLEDFAQMQIKNKYFDLAIIAYNAKLMIHNYRTSSKYVHEDILATYDRLMDLHKSDTDSTDLNLLNIEKMLFLKESCFLNPQPSSRLRNTF